MRNLADGLSHQGDEHVEEKNVSEDDVDHQQKDEDGLETVVVRELQVTHPNGELEELQAGVVEVVVRWAVPSG